VRDRRLTSTLAESRTLARQQYNQERRSITSGKILTGKDAIKEVIREYGREITQEMVPIIEWEGYATAPYKDTKGVETVGVGQTGRYASLPYPEVFHIFKKKLLRYTPELPSLPDSVQDALLVANYRGTWQQSPKTRALFSEGLYTEAADEYLDNDEYRDPETPEQIRSRFEYVAEAIRSLA